MTLKRISIWLKNCLQKYLPEESNMKSALSYGVDMALYTMLSTAGLLLISLLMKSLLCGVIIIITCYFNQTIGGGYHARTHARCFISMSLFLIVGVAFCKLCVPKALLCAMGIVSTTVLFMQPVVLHPNRFFLKRKLPYFIKRSKYATLIELFLIVACVISEVRFFNAFIIALVFSALSRTAAKYSKHCNVDYLDASKME